MSSVVLMRLLNLAQVHHRILGWKLMNRNDDGDLAHSSLNVPLDAVRTGVTNLV